MHRRHPWGEGDLPRFQLATYFGEKPCRVYMFLPYGGADFGRCRVLCIVCHVVQFFHVKGLVSCHNINVRFLALSLFKGFVHLAHFSLDINLSLSVPASMRFPTKLKVPRSYRVRSKNCPLESKQFVSLLVETHRFENYHSFCQQRLETTLAAY